MVGYISEKINAILATAEGREMAEGFVREKTNLFAAALKAGLLSDMGYAHLGEAFAVFYGCPPAQSDKFWHELGKGLESGQKVEVRWLESGAWNVSSGTRHDSDGDTWIVTIMVPESLITKTTRSVR